MVTLVTPAGTVNCCAAPVKLKVCVKVTGVGVTVGAVVGVFVAVAVGTPVAVAVAAAVGAPVAVVVALGAPGVVAVAVAVAIGAPVALGAAVAVAAGTVAVGGVVGTGDCASTGVGATIEWTTGKSAAAMPNWMNARRGSRVRLAGLTTGSANKCAFSSLLNVSHTNSSASGTFHSAPSVAAICCGLVCPSHSCHTRAAVGFSAWTCLRCQSYTHTSSSSVSTWTVSDRLGVGSSFFLSLCKMQYTAPHANCSTDALRQYKRGVKQRCGRYVMNR